MGSNQTKENVTVNENLSNVAHVHNKLNIIGIVMIVIIIMLIMVFAYALKRRFIRGVRKWLRKEMVASSVALPTIKVETVQPQHTMSPPPTAKVVL